jgi:hypothetical protein
MLEGRNIITALLGENPQKEGAGTGMYCCLCYAAWWLTDLWRAFVAIAMQWVM